MATRVNQLLTQNLQCPICLSTYTDPKLLPCSHTYCRACLAKLFKSQHETTTISCPVCRKSTMVPNGDIACLQTNIPIQTLVNDVKNQSQICSICTKSDEKPLAITYCQECDDYMCVDCHKAHANWDKFAGHEVVKVEDVISGKVMAKRRRKCKKHASENEECFCQQCKKYVCFRCGMMEHTRAGHDILEGLEHEESQKEKIQELRGRAGVKKSLVDDYIVYIEGQQAKLKTVLEKLTHEIEHTCEESILQLKERRDHLIKDCKRRIDGFSKELQDMKDTSRLKIGQIEDVSGLVGNGVKVPLEGEALAAHDTLCQELEGILGKTNLDYDKPQGTTTKGERVSFLRVRNQTKSQNELDLGMVEIAHWSIGKTISFSSKDSVNCAASMPDGRVVVGSRFGGLQLVSLQGTLEAALKGVGIRRVCFLSDGRFVVRDIYNNISLYSASFTKLDVEFDTPGHDEGGFGGLEVDRTDSILVTSFIKLKKIFIYRLTGGKPIKQLQCDYEPSQVFLMRNGRILVVTGDFSISVIEASSGKVKHHVTKEGIYIQPAVCLDGTILLALVKHSEGILSIEQYTRDLVHLRTLVVDHKITVPQHPWYHLREFQSGELAFCTPDRMYIFEKTVMT